MFNFILLYSGRFGVISSGSHGYSWLFHYGVTPDCFGDHVGCLGMNPGGLLAKKVLPTVLFNLPYCLALRQACTTHLLPLYGVIGKIFSKF